MENYKHSGLARGKWSELNFFEQMGNIGSELSRAGKWQGKNEVLSKNALERAFELLDLTIADPKSSKRLKELMRVREVLGDIYINEGREYKTEIKDLDKYFFQFAIAARQHQSSVSSRQYEGR